MKRYRVIGNRPVSMMLEENKLQDMQRKYAEWASKQEPRLFNLNAAPQSGSAAIPSGPGHTDAKSAVGSAVAAPINAAPRAHRADNGSSRELASGGSNPCARAAAPINAATQAVSGDTEGGGVIGAPVAQLPQKARTPSPESRSASAAPNELLALARSWDLWGGAAFVLFVLWLAVSSVFSLS